MALEKTEIVITGDASSLVAAMKQATGAADGVTTKVQTLGEKARDGFGKFDLGASAAKRSLGSMGDALGGANSIAVKALDAFGDLGDMLSRGALMGGIGVAIGAFTMLNKHVADGQKALDALAASYDAAANRVVDSKRRLDAAGLSGQSQLRLADIDSDIATKQALGFSTRSAEAEKIRLIAADRFTQTRVAIAEQYKKEVASAATVEDVDQRRAVMGTIFEASKAELLNAEKQINVEVQTGLALLDRRLASEKNLASIKSPQKKGRCKQVWRR